jgi:glutathione S-transferase
MIELYHFRNSVCSQKARMTLFEKGLEWKSHEVNLFASEQYDPKYLALNPKGYVPTLVHDGNAVWESTLICEYLEDCFPEPALMPAAAAARVKARLWSKAVDEGLFTGATVFSFAAMFRERMMKQTEEQRQRRYLNIGDPERRDRYMSMFEQGLESPFVFRAVGAYDMAFKRIEEALSGGAQWLAGDMFSLAEINLAPFVARLENLLILDPWIADRPATAAWWQRLKQRPSYQAEVPGSITAEEDEEMRVAGAKISARVAEIHAEYRAWAAG